MFQLGRLLFGDDVFVSYSRHDGMTYAERLVHALKDRGYSCRADLLKTDPGEQPCGPARCLSLSERSTRIIRKQ